MFYGKITNYHILALLPSYLERNNSSLVYMVRNFIKLSNSSLSGTFLNDYDQLFFQLTQAKKTNRKIILIGVPYALLDFLENYDITLSGHYIIETGGMKGKRKEIIREELHDTLKNKFRVTEIHSEYGMTELQSQSYSKVEGRFLCPISMKIILREFTDPFHVSHKITQGGINVIDLANFNTCSFIETQDIGKLSGDGFEVIGRFDNSDTRGCNLMY